MSEESIKSKQHTEQITSDDYNSDEDPFNPFLTEDFEQCAFFTDSFCDQLLPRTTQILLEYNSGKWVPRLREPRDLYGLSPTAGHLHLVRWPHQYEVIRERIEHIEWIPPQPEPLYSPTGLEIEPLCPDPGEGAVVYLADGADKDSSFMYSRIGGTFPSKQVLPQSWDDWDNTLIFEARFESGNLQKVVKINDFDYQLTLRTDLYTNKHTQWYYFQVTNTQAGMPYRFTIVNFTKPTSLYNRGMRPLLYSEAEAKIHKVGWQRTGDEIKYYKNNLSRDGRQYFSLTWTFQFPHDRDTCYFAHCYPYTYSNLQDYLSAIARDPRRSKFCKIRILCHSLARNIVYVLTITNPLQDFKEEKHKSAVILTARVHPGETNSSWMMKGFLDYILGDSNNAQLLRDTFVFKIIPMLNPDGVIVGNYRCSLAGRDLNRNYKSDLKESFPAVWYTRTMIKRMMEERNVLLYCDLHGHSRKENVFMYGCEKRDQQEEGAGLHQRIFPFIMSKNCPEKFSFPDCSFKIQKGKEGTGRVVMWKMGISNSYTLEVTFCGSKLGNRHGTHFSTKDLESIGYHFCDSLLDFCNKKKSKYNECLKELEEMVKQDDPSASVNDTVEKDSSSDSSDSNEPAVKLETQAKPRKKYLKTKKERSSFLESSGRRFPKHSYEPMSEAKKTEESSHRISKSQEQILKNTRVFQKLKLMELQNMQREKYEITKQNIEPLPRSPNAKKGCSEHFWECVKEENKECERLSYRGSIYTNSFFQSSLKGSRRRHYESKTLAGFHELFKETASIVKGKPHDMLFTSQADSMPDEPARYTVRYLSHYFPEQGLNIGWDLAQPLKHIISQRLFLPPAILEQTCNTSRRNGALSGCRLPRVENMRRETKIQRRTSLIHVESHPSSLVLSQATGENNPGKGYVTLELGEKEMQNMALAQGTNFYSPGSKAATWRLEKYQNGRTISCKEKTSQMKGILDNLSSNLDDREKKRKEQSPSRNVKPDINSGGSHEESFRLSGSSHTQDFLQLSLPLVSEGKYRQSTEKYERNEQHPKSLGQYRPRLGTLMTTKGTNKTIFLKHYEDGEASTSTSLLHNRLKMPVQNLLCQSESKVFSKRRKSECLNHRPSVQDLSTTTERISFHA
ncbi:cytosolic carboxypeptidase 3 isoform X4 [Rhineura floridana]|uniref:cytosolic carboxypeptidase 3 isoform X4 n=1 Tax=Rhineura floridana TaxID=261503 RepID=UPI002AC85E74|nr:cytosolic carboxypeptidase 3 isoform X4 [Rhineura floridana]XP_061495402.1 cytosolic carboxypeptidase 3 isoform X4 [Rhineura floridana]XP_061495403.1 cytosolic carboxypeptidase 3 isoform X4 [Rhineura floridana]XP_061495404.1 cytosolic carboxypeptidase 3 isoform X4 [Rhineura floridana]XP_061495405.1 cytosolic carboxypeptidase 3 isoform X4 [Rhineura floridana]XP_061495406.1 cytosolic carboxypeptidase 3 isoform X4 [Rhineura floridana]